MDENIEWYCAKDGQQYGPVSESEVSDLIKTKIIGADDSIWNENMNEWIPVKNVKNFEHLFKNQTKKLPPPLPINNTKLASLPSMWADEGIDTPAPELWNNRLFLLSNLMFVFSVGFLFILLITAPNDPPDSVKVFRTLSVMLIFLGLIISSIISFLLVNRKYNWWLRIGKLQLTGEDDYTLEFIDDLNCKVKQNLYTYIVSENRKFICIFNGKEKIIAWKIVKYKLLELPYYLELVDQTGKIFSFKMHESKEVIKPQQIGMFSSKRIKNLLGGWVAVAGNVKGVEFTNDDAAIFSDGSVGKYIIRGEEPNEVVEIVMLEGTKRTFQIISSTATQLVISENGQPTTLRRPEKKTTNSTNTQNSLDDDDDIDEDLDDDDEEDEFVNECLGITSQVDDNNTSISDAINAKNNNPEINIIDDPNKRNQPEPPPKGFWGKVSSFLFNFTCPNCKQRSGKEINQYVVREAQRWETHYDYTEKRDKPMPMNYWTTEHVYKCNDCQHQWIAHFNHRAKA